MKVGSVKSSCRDHTGKGSVGIHGYLALSYAKLRVLEALFVFPDSGIGWLHYESGKTLERGEYIFN